MRSGQMHELNHQQKNKTYYRAPMHSIVRSCRDTHEIFVVKKIHDMDERKGIGEQEADTVLGWLLDPPAVPDSAWYSRAGAILLKNCLASPQAIFTQPLHHRPCERLIKILHEGSFRSQSTVLDVINSAIEFEEQRERPATTQSSACEDAGGAALHFLSGDTDMPVLTAALRLCSEQQRDDPDPTSETAAAAAAVAGDAAGGGPEPAMAYVQQNCCEDPYDCEEPAVREAALRLLARLCAAAAATLDAAAAAAAALEKDPAAASAAAEPPPGGDPDDPDADAAALRAYRPRRRAVPSPSPPTPPAMPSCRAHPTPPDPRGLSRAA
jgi:hypothetical protein